jgi:hypothetical protein
VRVYTVGVCTVRVCTVRVYTGRVYTGRVCSKSLEHHTFRHDGSSSRQLCVPPLGITLGALGAWFGSFGPGVSTLLINIFTAVLTFGPWALVVVLVVILTCGGAPMKLTTASSLVASSRTFG